MENYFGEKWKKVKFNYENSNNYQLEVSNLGRVRSKTQFSQGNILKGSMINGYKILKISFFKNRTEEAIKKFAKIERKIIKLTKVIQELKELKEKNSIIQPLQDEHDELKKSLSISYQADTKARIIRHSELIHRLVATYFLNKPTKQQTIVSHLDHNKLNNQANNLKWMSPEENYVHRVKNPAVIAEFKSRGDVYRANNKTAKLSITKVMLLKKLLVEQKTTKQLAKQFKISEMQVLRIKNGQNWADVPAAF